MPRTPTAEDSISLPFLPNSSLFKAQHLWEAGASHWEASLGESNRNSSLLGPGTPFYMVIFSPFVHMES